MLDCCLVDIPLEGYPFTWFHSKGTLIVVEEWLDYALTTKDWLDLHPDVELKNTLASMSDHSPIILYVDAQRHVEETKIGI